MYFAMVYLGNNEVALSYLFTGDGTASFQCIVVTAAILFYSLHCRYPAGLISWPDSSTHNKMIGNLVKVCQYQKLILKDVSEQRSHHDRFSVSLLV